MHPFHIFISSVQKEFAMEREALYLHFTHDALLKHFFVPVMFEYLPAVSQTPGYVYLKELDACQLYLGLIGEQYGYEDEQGISPTEHEYDHATTNNIERWIFIKAGTENNRHPKEEVFYQKLSEEISWKKFTDVDHLKHEVSQTCVHFLQRKGLIASTGFDAALHPTATLSDISEEKIKQFIAAARSKRGFPLMQGSTVEKVLTHLNMLQQGQLTNSALLVFGKKPQQFFPTAIVKCAHFHGTTVQKPIPDHKVFQGDVFELVDLAVDFVLSKIPVSVGTRQQQNAAPIAYGLPRAAVTEAIVNAIAHRDYTSNGSVQVMLFADRLEITNPGSLPPELTVSKLKVQHTSYPANPLLAECMYQAGYIERFGTGTLEIIRLAAEAHLEAPEFDVQEGFKVVLWRELAAEGAAQSAKATGTDHVPDKHRTSTGQAPDKYRAGTGQVPGKSVNFTEIERVVLVLEGEMKRADIQSKLELKHRDYFMENYLQPAMDEHLIEMTIPHKPTSSRQRYRLTDKGIALQKKLYNERESNQ